MYRTKIKELIKWKISNNRKPLIVMGARQVGKTWLIQEFGKQEYKQMVYNKLTIICGKFDIKQRYSKKNMDKKITI